MLKITTLDDGTDYILKLEGKLLANWIDELNDACQGARGRLCLDLRDLIYADAAGAQTLRELLRAGTPIANISPFVSELLKENHA